MAALPLEGIRIVDITVIWAGPFATMQLADWGAEVIRVESTQHWQFGTRGVMARPPKTLTENEAIRYTTYPGNDPGERPWNRFSLFNAHARNKLSCTMDLTRPDGREMFKRLIKKSDVFLESNAPHAMENLELTYDVIKEWNPGIIMLSMSGFGGTGPYKYYRALGAQQEAFIGHTYIWGYEDMDPSVHTVVFHTDEAAGASAAFAVLAALHHRNRTGEGQFIDMAQAEATMPQIGEAIMDYGMNRRIHERRGNKDIHHAVQGAYLCKGATPDSDTPPGEDKWVVITIHNDDEWEGFCRATGNLPWTRDDRFCDQLSRLKHHDELNKLIQQWTMTRQNYDIMKLLQKEKVPAGPVLDTKDAFDDPHIRDRSFFEPLTQEDCGTHLYPGLSWRISKTPNKLRLPPCRLGEHNDYVYKSVIGVSDTEYDRLIKEGHIGTEPKA